MLGARGGRADAGGDFSAADSGGQKKIRLAIALQYSDVCKNCKGTAKCKDQPTKTEPLEMECPACNEAGCIECDFKGFITITCCPLTLITPDVWQMLRFAELFEKGLPPIQGGVLDQAENFIAACGIVFREKQFWKSKLGLLD